LRFAETLDRKRYLDKTKFKAVMGGSLGGNMTFRLGRRTDVPWLPKFIVWSPASIWQSLGEGNDILKHIGPRKAFESADAAANQPTPGDRADFFGGWDKPILPLIIPMAQSDTWTSDYYPCKKSSVAGARLDRQETYDKWFLAWHWRLGAEQLLYSHQTTDLSTGLPRYMSNQKPMLLACGLEDHVAFNDICPATQRTAPLMIVTPGKALFLDKTGHSLDNERRTFWAREILEFLK
jgi:pimeloyl-ACP methyl ester carboxylesterase